MLAKQLVLWTVLLMTASSIMAQSPGVDPRPPIHWDLWFGKSDTGHDFLGHVNAAKVYKGDLYLGGSVFSVGKTPSNKRPVNNILRFNDQTGYSLVGSSPFDGVRLTSSGPTPLGGAVFTINRFETIVMDLEINGEVYVDYEFLIVGGQFDLAGSDSVANIVAWDGDAWVNFGSPPVMSDRFAVTAMTRWDHPTEGDKLFVACVIGWEETGPCMPNHYHSEVFMYDTETGTWSSFDFGLTNYVNDMIVHDGKLFLSSFGHNLRYDVVNLLPNGCPELLYDPNNPNYDEQYRGGIVYLDLSDPGDWIDTPAGSRVMGLANPESHRYPYLANSFGTFQGQLYVTTGDPDGGESLPGRSTVLFRYENDSWAPIFDNLAEGGGVAGPLLESSVFTEVPRLYVGVDGNVFDPVTKSGLAVFDGVSWHHIGDENGINAADLRPDYPDPQEEYVQGYMAGLLVEYNGFIYVPGYSAFMRSYRHDGWFGVRSSGGWGAYDGGKRSPRSFHRVITRIGPGNVADVTGSSDPDDLQYGVPDRTVDCDDWDVFYHYFNGVSGVYGAADVSAEPVGSLNLYGSPDGIVDSEDEQFYIDAYNGPSCDFLGLAPGSFGDPRSSMQKYIEWYLRDDPRADVNRDGRVDASDFWMILEFHASW